ncbi:MAG: bacillithiol biosynthesis cysteine-adding enzyme BshC [Balneolaceae bacterium]|nr:bacillithiol biosynthesis cysteine-adding enzyme BshC [Balneolaceae bacterium]MBO6547461.1 bacillithiol biosynthesis cysteine-adding enzyme BshC [Balneolaceae bacterium]MBO6647592.1 bacillithiol biosynthesis cysteine-adding enzyme BshC [Balneolaceae bacterium]
MSEDHCSFQQLPFSNLFNTYISDYFKLKDFYSGNPFDENQVKERAGNIVQPESKERIAKALKEYHQFLGISDSQQSQLNKFSKEESLVFVTGQQLGVYGGPLFTVYKTITTILLARKWEKILDKPVVPIFWLADEDHDFEEIASVGIPDYDEFKKIGLIDEGNGQPVSVQEIKETIKEFEASLRSELQETDFTEKLFSSLNKFYTPGKTHVQAFAQLMNSWFAEEGLLIVGSNFGSIKELSKEVFKTSVTAAEDIFDALENKSVELEKNFHRQVVIGESNLFFIDAKGGRLKLERSNGDWIAGDLKVSEEKLLSMIEENPQNFSPNVFLRPVLQDVLLPTIGYVAGPGELAYYGQMKSLYPFFDLQMPIIFPRLSISLIESGIERIMEKLPFAMCSYNQRIEDLEAAYVDQTNSKDIEGVFADWKQSINEISEKPIVFIKGIDPTLEGTAGKVVTGFSNEIDKLKGKVYRAIKQQEQTQLNRISKIKSQLFPDGLQERSVSPVYFMNKYGLDIWQNLLNDFEEEDLDLTIHHIVGL